MIEPDTSIPASARPATRLAIKVVPGAARDEIAGPLGDRLKLRISAPPQDGQANQAVCRLLAAHLAIKPRQVEIISGHAHPEKLVRITGLTPEQVRAALT